jgi:hypothetical protein
MFRRRQKKAFTHGMTHHVVSKGLANPKSYRESVSGWRTTVLTKNGPAVYPPVATPLHVSIG